MPSRPLTLLMIIAIILALLALSIWRRSATDSDAFDQRSISPMIMGTTSRITAVGPPERVNAALNAALGELEKVNLLASTYNPESQLSRFNQAPADSSISLDPALLEVMSVAREFSEKTGGAFDITMRPVGLLWSRAAREKALPSEAALDSALALVGYRNLVMTDSTAVKLVAGMEVSLDAIVKGYAVDQALEALRRAGMTAGLVEVGGDLACFGAPRDAPAWHLGIQNPWAEESLGTLRAPLVGQSALGVCTSGNYRRYVEIEGVRYSHIVDPRTGRPADAIPSVTVIAPDAMTADGWATALSVLPLEEGMALIEDEEGVEALWISGTQGEPVLTESSGFSSYRLLVR